MRIIAGQWRGRPLTAPKDRAVRPTTDRIREALFSKLDAMDAIQNAKVLDCFAGTGALGFEALSRGAGDLTAIEKAPSSIKLIKENQATLGAQLVLLRQDATKLGACLQERGFDLIFLDPPYGKYLAPPSLNVLQTGGWIAPKAVIVIETDKRETLILPDGFTLDDERVYGDTRLTFISPA